MSAKADAAAGARQLRKRKTEDDDDAAAAAALHTDEELKEAMATAGASDITDDALMESMAQAAEAAVDAAATTGDDGTLRPMKREGKPTFREIRLEQNRKAARESRRRKKIMVEELQRSVIFFSRANGTLKQQNDELTRLLMQAQTQIAQTEGGQAAREVVKTAGKDAATSGSSTNAKEQAEANAVAQQAVLESQGFPAAAARAAAQTMSGTPASLAAATSKEGVSGGGTTSLPVMQPGATMQAMANFQQAAAAAMQAAMGQMSTSIPNVNLAQFTAQPQGVNPQQAYTDTMTALAMQQAAAAQASNQYGMPFYPMMWGQPTAAVAPAVTATAAATPAAPTTTETAAAAAEPAAEAKGAGSETV